jgi:hypothetical protein
MIKEGESIAEAYGRLSSGVHNTHKSRQEKIVVRVTLQDIEFHQTPKKYSPM